MKLGASTSLALLCTALSGCLHQQKVPPLAPQAKTPNIYVPPPDQANLPPMEAKPPAGVTDAKPVVAEEVKPKKRPKKQANTTPPPSPAPTVAVATPPAETATPETAKLGALGSGTDANPGQQKDVAEKISAVEKRITDLPSTVQDHEQKQIAKVKLFLKEASDALKGGDVEGAKILATKADLLVDDVQK
jgi:outer membrane biosynthesis protein TonB